MPVDTDPRAAAWDAELDRDLAEIIRQYGPGDTEEQRTLRRNLAQTRMRLRLYAGMPLGKEGDR
jgi:hypothetical protein